MTFNIFNEKRNVQTMISEYIGNLVMTKLKHIHLDENGKSYALYYAKIGCLLCIEDRYIVVIVENDNQPIGTQENLLNMNWISFQARTLEKDKIPGALKSQQSISKINNIVSDKIKLNEKREDRFIYLADNVPVQVELILNDNTETYAESGSIQSALDTYNCVITFLF